MRMIPLSRIANHRCPECDALLGQFALRSTQKAGLQRPRLNAYLSCPGCRAQRRQVPRPNGPGLFIWQVLRPALFGAIYLLGFAWVALQFPLQDGLLAPALALFAYLLSFALAGSLLSARLERHFFTVEVL
jgi:hypothetical protein